MVEDCSTDLKCIISIAIDTIYGAFYEPVIVINLQTIWTATRTSREMICYTISLAFALLDENMMLLYSLGEDTVCVLRLSIIIMGKD